MLTIGLPFFNSEKTLANAIKSVILQSYTEWELLLLDDGSTDGSLSIANTFVKTDNRIKLISDGVNRGLVFRLNQVIDMAQGEYIARMDSDDMMMPEKLTRQMEMLEADKNIDVIDTAAYIINERGEPTGMRGMADLGSWDKKKTLKEVLLFHPTVIAKTSWYRANKYHEDFIRSEDFELWCRTFNKTVFARVYEPLFIYREGRIDVKNYRKSNQSHRKILRKYGPGVLTSIEIDVEIMKSHCKTGLYSFFSLFSLQHLLTAKRNSILSTEEQKKLFEVMDTVNRLSPFLSQETG